MTIEDEGNAPNTETGDETPAAEAKVDSPGGEGTEKVTPSSDAADTTAQTQEDKDSTPSSEDTADEDDSVELDDEALDAIWDAYKDRFTNRKSVQDFVKNASKREAARIREELEASRQEEQKVSSIVDQGKKAAEAAANAALRAKQELEKARNGEAFDESVISPEVVINSMRDYGAAVVAATKGSYDRAIETGFQRIFTEKVLNMTEEDSETLERLAAVANRMSNDPNQAAKAPEYFLGGILDFVADKAIAYGAVMEKQRVEARKTVKDKVAETNAVKLAKAQLAKEKAPPKVQPGSSSAPKTSGYTEKDYQEAIDKDDSKTAQAIIQEWMSQGITRPPAE